ncbi:MAG: lamin tail domain-containing protein [Fidelibacterota bacterium]
MKNLLSICLVLIMALGSAWGQLVINEIHADPDTEHGDANGDGVVDSNDDEFIEIYNNSSSAVDISAWEIHDNTGERHTFGANTTLNSFSCIVVFGGGNPTGDFGGALIQTSYLGLNNPGDEITILDDSGDTITTVSYGSEGGDDQALTRNPDITGDFVKHSTIDPGLLFSPGKTNDGDQSLPVTLSSFTAKYQQDKVLIQWTTESEMNNMGFNLYKGESEKGEFQKINTSIIPGAGNSSTQNNYSFTDTEVIPGRAYYYQLEDVTYSNQTKKHDKISVTIPDNKDIALDNYQLFPAYPNPCNPSTTIKFYLPDNSTVSLGIYDLKGNLVKPLTNKALQQGFHSYQWNGKDNDDLTVSNGIYLYRIMTTDGFTKTNKIILLK